MKPLRWALWIIALLLFVFHFVILVAYGAILFVQNVGPSLGVIFYGFLVLLAGGALIIGIIKGSIRGSTSFALFCAVSAILTAAGLAWFTLDDPPIREDHAAEDVLLKANGSYPHLELFNKADTKALVKANKKLGEGYHGKVDKRAFEEVWEEIADYRAAIEALDGFDVICDLPEGAALDMKTPLLHFMALREVAKIYQKYSIFKVLEGRGEEAVVHLCRLHRVSRKGMRSATVLISKMIFNALARMTLDSAYVAVLNENCDEKILNRLKESFTPLDFQDMSMERPIIAEYIALRSVIQNQLKPETFLNAFTMVAGATQKQEPAFPPASYFVYYFGFKPNKSLRGMKEYYDLLLEAQKEYPVDATEATRYLEQYVKEPQIRNMVGWILNSIAMPNLENYCKRTMETKVKSDLLSLVIHERLGESLDIKDLYTGDSYNFRKEEGYVRHPGEDGTFDTKDDITLGEKPPDDS
jgi:hypothetical protein